MLFSFIHISIFSTTNHTYLMIIFNHFLNKGHSGNLVFLDLNIVFNLSHPSNHSQL